MESEKETNTEKDKSTGVEAFRKLGLCDEVLEVIEELGFEKPSEIQEKAIPLILDEKDVIGKSSTGSGKTLAFGSGILERVEALGEVQSLILTPTRELAEQIAKALKQFSKHLDIKIACVYGGMDMRTQERKLRDADVVVGTPGRTLDHLKRRNFDASNVELLILDEADRMLEMGMIEDVEEIISHCPKERQTLLFSATISHEIRRIGEKHTIDPTYVDVKPEVDPTKLNQVFYDSPAHKKFSILVHLLKDEHSDLVMVFCNTRRQTDLIADNLKKQGLQARAIHGGLTQARRNQVMKKFHSGETLILVCTDVAARGLDIKGVSHVYNYDSAESPDEYTHRIGRTARAGKEGKAISIVAPRDFANFRNIMEKFRIQIKREDTPEVEDIRLDMSSQYKSRGRDNSRGFARRTGRGDRNRSRDRRSSYMGRGRSRDSSTYFKSTGSSYADKARSEGSSLSRSSHSRDKPSYSKDSRSKPSYSGDKPSYSRGGSSSGRSRFSRDSNNRSSGSRDSDSRGKRHGSIRRPPRGRSGRSDKGPRYVRSGSSRSPSKGKTSGYTGRRK